MTDPSTVPRIKFYNGYSMPMIGLGTYLGNEEELEQAIKDAIDAGYRHIDTAFFYGNEKAAGKGIRAKIADGTIKREDIFVTTKLWNNFHKEERVVPACRKSVENLGLDYVDLYLMHWPFAYQDGDDCTPTDETGKLIFADIDYLETWRGMEECQHLGLAKSIGISNFNSEQITRLLSVAKIKPVNNQIEVNLNLPQKKLIEFCKKHDITVTGFSPLARPGNRIGVKIDLGNEKVLGLAKKYNKTPQQIALRFVFQCGAALIPKSVTKSRIVQNIQIFDFELTAEEMSDLESKATGERVAPMIQAEGAKYFPFSIPF